MKKNHLKVKDLTTEELKSIEAGGIFKKLGCIARETWCKIRDTAKELAQLDWSGSPLGY